MAISDNKWVAKWIRYSMGEEIIMNGDVYDKNDKAPKALCLAFLKLPEDK